MLFGTRAFICASRKPTRAMEYNGWNTWIRTYPINQRMAIMLKAHFLQEKTYLKIQNAKLPRPTFYNQHTIVLSSELGLQRNGHYWTKCIICFQWQLMLPSSEASAGSHQISLLLAHVGLGFQPCPNSWMFACFNHCFCGMAAAVLGACNTPKSM